MSNLATTELSRSLSLPLSLGEVRVYTLDSGDSATVRRAAQHILAPQISAAPGDLELYSTPKGKPLLRNDAALHFSISHSRDMSMVAFTRVAPVGVDIERLRAVPNAEAILRRFFSAEDISTILSDDNRELRFVEAWTRAESRVKVRGASVWEAATPDPTTTVRQLSAPDGFAAAVAVANNEWSVTQQAVAIADLLRG